jgi:predicted nucleotidyltransferase
MSEIRFGIYNRSLELILKVIQNYPEILEAKIYGSRAMGNFKKGSDIDLALFGQNISSETILELSAKLNQQEIIPYHIDVVYYSRIKNNDLKNHIDEHGVTIYKSL